MSKNEKKKELEKIDPKELEDLECNVIRCVIRC